MGNSVSYDGISSTRFPFPIFDNGGGAFDNPGRKAKQNDAISADNRYFARQHDIGWTAQTVEQRMPATVQIVKLRLRVRIVDIDRRVQQDSCTFYFVEPLNPGRRLFANAAARRRNLLPALTVLFQATCQRAYFAELLAVRGLRRWDFSLLLELAAVVNQQRRVTTVVDDQCWPDAVPEIQCLFCAPPVFRQSLALPGKHQATLLVFRRAVPAKGDRGVVLRAEDVEKRPADIGTQFN